MAIIIEYVVWTSPEWFITFVGVRKKCREQRENSQEGNGKVNLKINVVENINETRFEFLPPPDIFKHELKYPVVSNLDL